METYKIKGLKMERTYNIPLRREWLKVPRYKRAKKAAKALREFVSRHMKSDDICIGTYANMEIWKNGIRNPPHHIKVNTKKLEDGKVLVELEGKPYPELKKQEKVEKSKLAETVEKFTGKKSKKVKKQENKEEKSHSKKPGEKDAVKENKAEDKRQDKTEQKTEDKKEPKKETPKNDKTPKETTDKKDSPSK